MKKILMMLAIAAYAVSAQAATYTKSYTTYTKTKTKSRCVLDTAKGTITTASTFSGYSSELVYYKAYSLTASDCAELIGKTVTGANDVHTWLGENFAVNKGLFTENAHATTDDKSITTDYMLLTFSETYKRSGTGATADIATLNAKNNAKAAAIDDNKVIVFFYENTIDDKTYNAYRVVYVNTATLSTTDTSTIVASSGNDWTDWTQAVTTPEPTSGLLLLIGVAGLALKRKRA